MAGVLLPTDCSPAQPSPRAPSAWTPQSTAGATCHLRREHVLCPARGSPALQPRGSPAVSPGIASLSRSLPAPSPAPAKAQCSDLRTMHPRS